MTKCPFCGSDTRPGDNFCLTCGNRLPAAPSFPQQAQPGQGEPGMAAEEEWHAPMHDAGTVAAPSAPRWSDMTDMSTSPNAFEEIPMRAAQEPPVAVATAAAPMDGIEKPARFTVRSENGEYEQDYTLDKLEIAIGRAPNSDILLAKDKLTSRRHATVRYEEGRYILRDERSANGTFVNRQQLDELAPYLLQDGDHISIGEHELIFHHSAAPTASSVEDMPTIAVPINSGSFEPNYIVHENETVPAITASEFSTDLMSEEPIVTTRGNSTPAPVEEAPDPVVPTLGAPIALLPTADAEVTFQTLTSFARPSVPDIGPLMAALSSLDGQIMSMQEQLNATQDAMRERDDAVTQTANQLRSGVRRVSDRMDNAIADVARRREEVAWTDLLQIMEDVQNNPRDIEYVTKLARKARELKKVFEMHQGILNTLAECNSLLRGLLGENAK